VDPCSDPNAGDARQRRGAARRVIAEQITADGVKINHVGVKQGVVQNPLFLGYTGERKPPVFKAGFLL
jgi:hypothetical protein